MNKGSPFYVETYLGKLQLTKGAYLTLQKRKYSTLRTIAKTKPILKEQNKNTIKKSKKEKYKTLTTQPYVAMYSRQGQEILFQVTHQNERLRGGMVSSLPSIEMNYDNDVESEWCQIDGCLNNLTLSLSLAAYDNCMSRN